MTRARPPRWAERLVELVLPDDPRRAALLGDLEEHYRARAADTGRARAGVTYVAEVIWAIVQFARPDRADRADRVDRLGRGVHRSGWWTRVPHDLRVAARRLRRSPAFTATAVLTLWIAIAGNVSMYAVVSGVLLEPLPYPHPDELVRIEHMLPGFRVGDEGGTAGAPSGQIIHYRDGSRALRHVAGYSTFEGAVSGNGGTDAEYVRIGLVTPSLFDVLGVSPNLGRAFRSAEMRADAGGVGVTVISHDLWRRRYGGDERIIGQTIQLDGFTYEVVGVMPRDFGFPDRNVKMWIPAPLDPAGGFADPWFAEAIGRVQPEATLDGLERELQELIGTLVDRYPDPIARQLVHESEMRARVTTLKAFLVEEVASTLWILFGGFAVVFAIAAVNVTNLVLIRMERQQREVAIRTALGAGRADVVRHVLGEAVLISGVAGALAVWLAVWVVSLAGGVAPDRLPRAHEIAFGPDVVAVALSLTGAGVIILTMVALAGIRRRSLAALRRGTRGSTAGARPLRTRNLLVSAQVGMALALLVASGLLFRSFLELGRVDPGFDAANVLTFRVPYPLADDPVAGARGVMSTRFHHTFVERLAGLPGVVRAGTGECVPLLAECGPPAITLIPEGAATPDADPSPPVATVQHISPGYLETLGISILRGRSFVPADHEDRRNVALISQRTAEIYWPGRDPLGSRFRPWELDDPVWFTVVGIVGDVRAGSLRDEPLPAVYWPQLTSAPWFASFVRSYVVKTSIPPAALVPAVWSELAAMRPDIPLAGLETMEDIVAASTIELRFSLWLLAGAAITAMLLCTVGLYGVVAYTVGQRRREIGIRLALGADARRIRRMIVRHGAVMTALGLGAGIVIAWLGSGWLERLLFGITPADPITYVIVSAGLALTVLVAAYIPARRASRLPPTDVLRVD